MGLPHRVGLEADYNLKPADTGADAGGIEGVATVAASIHRKLESALPFRLEGED
jgi:hypothetical protein